MKISPQIISARKFVQLIILITVIFLPVAQFYGFVNIRGNFYSWHFFGIPFADPLVGLQTVMQGISYDFWPNDTILIGGFLSLFIAFLFGRIFCSWICPYGVLSEILWKFSKKNKSKKIKLSIWKWRLLLVFVGLFIGVFLGIPFLNQFSAPGLISISPQEFWRVVFSELGLVSNSTSALNLQDAGTIADKSIKSSFFMLVFIFLPVILVLVLEFITKKRIWCSYLCPQALLLMLFARLGRHSKTPISAMQIKWESGKCNCKGRSPCAEICSLSLNPRSLEKKDVEKNACINCGDCVKECAKVNPSLKEKALNLGFYP